jgi:hypothetical protein
MPPPEGLAIPAPPEGLAELTPPPPPPDDLGAETLGLGLLLVPLLPEGVLEPPPLCCALAGNAKNRHITAPEAAKSKFLYLIFMIVYD